MGGTMKPEELKARTKQFALDVLNLTDSVPFSRKGDAICKQLIRSATSVGANYRSACRARSKADFISKITVVEEESDESQYWLEILMESGVVPIDRVAELLKEADELTAIFTSSGKTAKLNRFNPQSTIRNPKSQ